MSPWVSKAQQAWGNSPAGHKALGDNGVDEWNNATKGKRLPARKGKSRLQVAMKKLAKKR